MNAHVDIQTSLSSTQRRINVVQEFAVQSVRVCVRFLLSSFFFFLNLFNQVIYIAAILSDCVCLILRLLRFNGYQRDLGTNDVRTRCRPKTFAAVFQLHSSW